MLALKFIESGSTRTISQWTNRLLFAVYLIIGGISSVSATPLDPFDGYNPDTGTTYFIPSPVVVGVELLDPFDPATTFGFYFKSDSSTLIPIFDGSDSGGEQKTIIDFVNGQILDYDLGLLEAVFTPSVGSIGLFLDVLGVTLFSDQFLNPNNTDLFSAFQNIDDPALWAVVFENINPDGSLTPINVTLVGNITAVPEPSVIALFLVALPVMLLALRRRKLAVLQV